MTDVLQASRERVGRQIRKARKDAHLSHDTLAERVGTSRQHLIKLEKGKHAPRPEMLAKIADATGKSDEFFLSDADEDEEQDVYAALTRAVRNAAREEARTELARLIEMDRVA